MSPLVRGGAAVVAGLAAAMAFEPIGWALLLPLAVAGLSLALVGARARTGVWVGALFGSAFMAGLLPWLQIIGVDAWIGLSLLQGGFFALLGVLLVVVAALPAAPVWSACTWVAVEVLRSSIPWGGFPWGRLAFATADTPFAAAMPWVATAGTTFLVALAGTTLAWLLTAGRQRPRVAAVTGGGVVAALVAVWLLGPGALAPSSAQAAVPAAGNRIVRVAAVQGDVPGEGMDVFSERRVVLENHVGATRALAEQVERGEAQRPDFVLWPENSTDMDPFVNPDVYADIQGAVDAIGVPVLVGAMVGGPGPRDVRNQGIVWEPGAGPVDSYSKTRPVPFGEYIPHRAQLARLFERLDQIPRDMVPGTEPGVLELDGATIGDVICFEVAYDQVVRDVVRAGAQMLVVQTNNATYMGTGQIEQQFEIARLRAAETARHVVVVATNGVSGVVGPTGEVEQRAPVRETALLSADVALGTDLTPAVRFGRWVELVLLLAAAASVAVAGGRAARERRVRPAEVSSPTGAVDSSSAPGRRGGDEGTTASATASSAEGPR